MWKAPVAQYIKCWPADPPVLSSRPAGGGNFSTHKWNSIAQSLSLSPFHCPGMTEILLKRSKISSHPFMTERLTVTVITSLAIQQYFSSFRLIVKITVIEMKEQSYMNLEWLLPIFSWL